MTAPTSKVGRITPAALQAARGAGEPVVVLDVRRRDAWSSEPARIPGAVWVPLDEVPHRARDLPADAHLILYCS
jgi:rhodanese-related sulfurtransferase